MNIRIIGRIAGIATLTLALAGCIDMTSEINVESDTNAKVTTTTTMSAQFYPMIKAMRDQSAGASDAADASASEEDDFCTSDGADLVENADGSATCTEVAEGPFDTVASSNDSITSDATFTVVGRGVVRVALPTKDWGSELTQDEGGDDDAQTQAMLKAYFEGHSATIRVTGKRITDTNLTLSPDGTSAELVIPFTSLMDGTAGLPDELYAVVDTN